MLHAGDLAKKKIYPALFALYVEGHLPDDFSVFGYARSKMSDDEFRKYIRYDDLHHHRHCRFGELAHIWQCVQVPTMIQF